MTLLTPKQITNWYLYGQSTKPNLINDSLIRDPVTPLNIKSTPAQDMNEYMSTGPGRFVKGRSFELVQDFFSTDLNTFASKTGFVFGKAYTTDEMLSILGLGAEAAKVTVTQSFVRDDIEDFAERSYIWNTGKYIINSDPAKALVPKFTVYANGEKRIDDFSARVFNDSFDFDGEGFSNLGNWQLVDSIDPSLIGRKVNIPISGTVSESIYDLNGNGYYDGQDFFSELGVMNSWDSGAWLLAPLLPQIETLATNLWNDGTIKFLDGKNRPILYGTVDGDNLTSTSFGETSLNVPHIVDYVQNGVVLISGKGNDTITGGAYNDSLIGGADKDTYIISGGNDTINDTGTGDIVQGYRGTAVETETDSGIYELADARVTKSGTTVTIEHPTGKLTLSNWVNEDYGILFEKPGNPQTPDQIAAENNRISPIALDISGNGVIDTYSLYAAANNAYFDIDNDGFKEKVQWLRPTDGWLARDGNGNGKIDNQNELFGDSAAQTAYQKLATLNTNNTGTSANVINSADSAWTSLRIWLDANSDGISQATELKTLASLGITSLSLESAPGSLQSTIVRNGTTYKAQDIFLNVSQLDSWYIGKASEVSDAALALPLSRGYGDVKSLHYAATANADLMTKMTEIKNLSLTSLDSWYAKLEAAVESWAGTAAVSSAGVNTLVDWGHKATMEKFAGTGAGSIPANSMETGYNLEKSYHDLLSKLSIKFLAQGALKQVFGNPLYDFATDQLKFSITHTQILNNAKLYVPADAADKAVYWSEIARILLDHTTAFGVTAATMQTAINQAAGTVVRTSPLTSWFMEGTTASDTLTGGSGHGYLVGGDGNDSLSGLGGNDMLFGGIGDDIVRGGTGNDGMDGQSGSDTYYYSRGDGDDWITDLGGIGQDRLVLTNIARSEVTFTRSSDHPLAFTGGISTDNNTVKLSFTGGGSILLNRQLYSDFVIESIQFSDGTTMGAQQVRDMIPITGTSGNDTIYGDYGNNIILAGSGADEIIGGEGNDSLNGEAGNDRIWGEFGNDTVIGGDGNDELQGNEDNDSILGGAGIDTLWGQEGNDTLHGGAGQDQMTGGDGVDIFAFTSNADSTKTLADFIWDFNASGDRIRVAGLGYSSLDTDGGNTEAGELRFYTSGSKTIITSDQTSFVLELNGIYTSTNLTNADFVWM